MSKRYAFSNRHVRQSDVSMASSWPRRGISFWMTLLKASKMLWLLMDVRWNVTGAFSKPWSDSSSWIRIVMSRWMSSLYSSDSPSTLWMGAARGGGGGGRGGGR